MATVIPAPAGSGNIAQNFALLGSQLGSLGQFIQARNLRQKQKLQQLALQQFSQQQGFQAPPNLPPEFLQNLLLQKQQIAGRAAVAQAKPIPPTQQITQKQLDRINLLEEKARKGTIKPGEAAELRSAIRRVQPKETFTPLRIEQTKGHLEAGGESTIFGNVVPFVTRKSAINYARRQLGPNWAQASPEAKEIIDRKWPAETKGTIKVISPAGERGTIPIEDWADAKKQGFRRR